VDIEVVVSNTFQTLQHVHPYLGKNSTQMIEQDLLLEGSRLKNEDKQVPGRERYQENWENIGSFSVLIQSL